MFRKGDDMSEQEINAIGRIDVDGSSRLAKMAAQANEMKKLQSSAKRAESAEAKLVQPVQQDDSQQLVEQVSEVVNEQLTPMNTSLRFQINDDTNEITVLIVDRDTEKVLHTIPADAIKNIPAGKLMQYFA
jgi:uncharacterized FlaG/YvyC family protein